jgi:two-component system cell cycle sensor histidine kinase/response regulator CckA
MSVSTTPPTPPASARPRGHAASERTIVVLALAALLLATGTGVAVSGSAALPISVAAAVAAAGALAMVMWQRKRDEAFRTLIGGTLDDARAGHFVSDATGSLVYANPAARRLFGDRVLDRVAEFDRLMAGDDRDLAAFHRVLREAEAGSAAAVELPVRNGSPADRWWLISARPLEGAPGHVHWALEDITDRREREDALRREQAKLIDFLNQAPVGFYSVDQDGRFLFVNATLARWLGVEQGELLDGSLRLHDFLDRAPDAPPYALTAGGDAAATLEVAMRSRAGRVFQASIAQTLVPDEAGEGVTTRSMVRDLTPEREIKAALEASEARFRRVFEDAPIGMALADSHRRLTEWNRALTVMIGRSEEDLAALPVAGLVAERQAETVDRRLESVLGGTEIDAPLELAAGSDRGELSLLLFAKRLETAAGEPPGLLLQFIDRTEQQKLETQFTQSQKMQAVGQLAGGIAHDFNNLLTAMIGFSDLLLLRHKPGDASFGDIMQIKQNANRAANLVRQLLAFSRQQTLQPRVLNITDALAELSNLLRRLIGENIELKMVHGREVGLVKVDQGQFEQVVINLAVNARDAMAHGGRLTIRTSNVTTTAPVVRGSEEMPPGEYVAIEVIDTGIGIPPDNINRIFDPFFSTKEVGSGTGLGLSTVYGIVRQTGGFIFVDSRPGEGTHFTIYLPLHRVEETKAAAAAELRDPQARDLTGAGRILLVEDEDPVRVFSARALRNKGYEVIEARSGEQALDHLAKYERDIDLLITDVVMPKMDGPTLIRRVRAVRPDIKVICISGYAEDRFRERIDAGGDTIYFLAKPFSLKQLAGKVKDVIRVRG